MTHEQCQKLIASIERLTEAFSYIHSDNKARRAVDRNVRKIKQLEVEYAEAVAREARDAGLTEAEYCRLEGLDMPKRTLLPEEHLDKAAGRYHRRHFQIRSNRQLVD